MLWSLIFSLTLPLSLFAADKSICTARELQRQDCRLSIGTYKVRLTSETVVRDDGTWHIVDPMPLKGSGVTWQKIRFDMLKGWPVLQLWLWDSGQGEATVQALHWYVTDAERRQLSTLAEGVVSRRRAKENKKYIQDAFDRHSLKVLKSGDLEWTLGKSKKTFSRVK